MSFVHTSVIVWAVGMKRDCAHFSHKHDGSMYMNMSDFANLGSTFRFRGVWAASPLLRRLNAGYSRLSGARLCSRLSVSQIRKFLNWATSFILAIDKTVFTSHRGSDWASFGVRHDIEDQFYCLNLPLLVAQWLTDLVMAIRTCPYAMRYLIFSLCGLYSSF